MPATYTLIASNTLTSNTSSVVFANIPNTYTDLVFRISVRDSNTIGLLLGTFTGIGSTADYSVTELLGNGATGSSARGTSQGAFYGAFNYNTNGTNSTSNTFTSSEIYIPNYTAAVGKPIMGFTVAENNSTTAYISLNANLFNSTTSIALAQDITFTPFSNFVSGSSFFLYGISSS